MHDVENGNCLFTQQTQGKCTEQAPQESAISESFCKQAPPKKNKKTKKNPHHEHQVLLHLHCHVGLSRLQSFLGVSAEI